MNKNLLDLFNGLVTYNFNFNVTAITTAMFFRDEEHAEWDSENQRFIVDAYRIIARIEIFDDPKHVIRVYACEGLDALVDMDNKEFQIMDAHEVERWALNELRDTQIL
jgi:hypothetical protein